MRLRDVILMLAVSAALPAAAYEVGDVVEDITLPTLEGGEASLYDHRGEIILLNFFTTWCPGCNEEAERIENDIHLAYAPQDSVTVIALDIQEPVPLVQGWAAAQGVTYAIWMAPDWTLFELFPNAIGIPYNAILDRDMRITYGASGFDLEGLTGAIDEILAQGQVADTRMSWGSVKALFGGNQGDGAGRR